MASALKPMFGNGSTSCDQGSCGIRKKLLLGGNDRQFAVSQVQIRDARPHFHKTTWELYIIQEGSGIIRLDGVDHRVGKGDVVEIPPNIVHEAIPDGEMTVLVVMSPHNAEINDIHYP